MVDASALAGLEGVNSYDVIANLIGVSTTMVMVLFAIIGIWSLIWKGLALWKSANKKSIPWFVVLLIFNTAGILDILYIYVFSKMGLKKKAKVEKTKSKPKRKRK